MNLASLKYATLYNGLRMKDALVSKPGDGEREVSELNFVERGVEEWLGDWQGVTAEFEEAVTSLYRKRQMDSMDDSKTPIFDPATGALTGAYAPHVLADYVMLSGGWRGLVMMQHLKTSGWGVKQGDSRLAVVTSKGTGKPAIPGYGWSWIGTPPVVAASVGGISEKLTARREVRKGMRVLIHVQCADPPAWPTGANDWKLQGELTTDDGTMINPPIVRYVLPEITGVGAWVADFRITSLADEITDLDWYVRWTSVFGTAVDVGGTLVEPNFTPTVSIAFIND